MEQLSGLLSTQKPLIVVSHELMEQLRDTAVLMLAAEKLEHARDVHREQQAAELVQSYSKRAVVGTLAAVAPASDLVIQGLLATRLAQSFCKLSWCFCERC